MIEGHRVPFLSEFLMDDATDRGDLDGLGPSGQKSAAAASSASCARTEPSLSPSYRGVAAELDSSGVVSDSRISSDAMPDDAGVFAADDCGIFPVFDMVKADNRNHS